MTRPPCTMMAMLSDTHPEAERVQIEILRRAGPGGCFRMLCQLTDEVMDWSRRAIVQAHPDWTQHQRDLFWVEVHYGRELAQKLRDDLVGRMPTPRPDTP